MTNSPTTPLFSGDYAAAMLALGEDCPYRAEDFDARRPEVKGIPALIHAALRATENPRITFRALQVRTAKVGARKALESIGIHCEDHLVMPRKITATVETPVEAPTISVEPFDDADDIRDPPVPPGVSEEPGEAKEAVSLLPDALIPLAHGFCQYIQEKLNEQLRDSGIKMARDVDTVISDMANFSKGVLSNNEHAAYSFADAMCKFTQANAPLPYQMTLQVVTPAGFPLTLTVSKTTAEELIGAMGKLDGWLVDHNYTVPQT